MKPTSLSALVFAIAFLTVCAHASAQAEEKGKLLANDGAPLDRFGNSVAISGATVIVGASQDDEPTENSGSAYLFDIRTGQQLFKLVPKDGAPHDRFGESVAISGTIAIVGAFGDDGFPSGSAYIFDTTTGEELFKIVSDYGSGFALFGRSVAIGGVTAIVGAPGTDSAHLFDVSDPKNPIQLATLLPSDAPARDFGYAVNIHGTTAIVGARSDDDNGLQSGSAYLFDTSTGEELCKLLPKDGAPFEQFGSSVAISGTIAIVGAWKDDENGTSSGSAYLFDTRTGQQLFKLLPHDGAPEDAFGRSVAIVGKIAIVGARGHDHNGSNSGSVYIFDTGTGRQLFKLVPDDGVPGAAFGSSITISGTTAIIGADGDDDNGGNSGSAYIFELLVGTNLTDVSLAFGTILIGGVSDLIASDNEFLLARSNFGLSAFEPNLLDIHVGVSGPREPPSTLTVTTESFITSPSGIATLRVRNWRTNEFEQVDQYPVVMEMSSHTTEGIGATDRVREPDRRIELSIKHVVIATFSPTGFDSLFDRVRVVWN